MKTLYLECNMGAAGDMLMGALLELLPDQHGFIQKMNEIGLPGVEIMAAKSVKCGITGTHIAVKVNGMEEESRDVHSHLEGHAHHEHHHKNHEHHHTHSHHHHAGMQEIADIIQNLNISTEAKEDIKNIYQIIAEAESSVHGTDVSEIHFHEVGAADAIADITGCVLLMHELKAEQIIVSPITTGYGQVRCAHGILPVPAPAAARILTGMPCKAGRIEGELCTPTGAAILKYFAAGYGRMPEMIMEKIGYGMGCKDFPAANCIRAILGESA